jgi:hypothetical protein
MGLATGLLLAQGVLPTVYKIHISELIISEWSQGRPQRPRGLSHEPSSPD